MKFYSNTVSFTINYLGNEEFYFEVVLLTDTMAILNLLNINIKLCRSYSLAKCFGQGNLLGFPTNIPCVGRLEVV